MKITVISNFQFINLVFLLLTYFWLVFLFYTSWKHQKNQKTFGFMVFSGGIKWEWPEMGKL